MNTHQLSEQGYNIAQLKRYRMFARFRFLVRIAALGIVFCAVVAIAAMYFARLPRERHARNFSFVERAVLGAKRSVHAAFLTISAEHEDGAHSDLPIAELYMRGKRIDKLKENLPASGREYQKAKFRYRGEALKVEARFRGDSINHWAFPQKSWRVALKKTDDIDDIRTLNLNVPRSDNQMANWLGYEMARRLGGLLVPEAEMVHFRLNRKYDGVRLVLEQPDDAFLLRRQMPVGKIFVGDISSEQIYGDVPRARLYQDAQAWVVRSPTEDVSGRELASLLRVIGIQDPYRLYYKLNKLLDVESFLRYMALLEFVGSVHVDATHNGKMYFNPVTGKFAPVVWDTVAYFWGNRQPLDLGTNELFRALLSVPEYRDRKDQILWEMVNGEFSTPALQRIVELQAKRLRKDVYAFPLKLHANDKGVRHVSNGEWETSVSRLLSTIAERNERIKKHLRTEKGRYHIEIQEGAKRARLAIANDGVSTLQLGALRIETSAPSVEVKRIGMRSLLKQVGSEELVSLPVDNGFAHFQANEKIRSARSFKHGARADVAPAVYIYEVRVKSGRISKIEVPTVTGSFTGSQVPLSSDDALLAQYQSSTGWWEPSKYVAINERVLAGKVEVTEDIILDDYSRLIIRPGAEVRIAPQKSILVRGGGIEALGTANAPILIAGTSETNPWGVLAVQSGSAKLEHVHFAGGSERKLQHAWYGSPVSLHDAEVSLRNLQLTDSRLVLEDARGSIDGLSYSGIHTTGYRAFRSRLQVKNVKKTGYKPVHRLVDYDGEVYGTSARSEREFKLALMGAPVNVLTLDEISKQMHTALTAAVADSDRWNAGKFTGTQYYHDLESKDFLFRDIYFDTKDRLNYQFGVSYRYRNRYKSAKDYLSHLKRPTWPEYWPHRLEFQAKVDRQELPGGYSTVDESRFEFRSASQPFSEADLPPPPPWEEEVFVPEFLAGSYNGMPTRPAKAVVDYLRASGSTATEFEFQPVNVLVTERHRQHLNIKTEWGSGPNPDQSFIISLDRSEVFKAKPYLDYLRRKRLGYKKLARPVPVGALVEVEIEFERNVSDVLDKKIKIAKAEGDAAALERLTGARDAFTADQQVLNEVLTEHFDKLGIQVVPADKSKYLQAMDILKR